MSTNYRTQLGSSFRTITGFLCLCFFSLTITCSSGGGSEEETTHDEHEMEMDMEVDSSGEPQVWFITPEDGATVTSPVAFEFGSENITIEPKGEVHAGAGHHHIGVNTDCLPAGELIPEADPWVHFGDGSAVFELQLPSGEHKITLQLGDGEHRTLSAPKLCTTITVNVPDSAE